MVEAAAGFTSKIHARADGQGRPLGFILTGGEASDYKAVDDLIAYLGLVAAKLWMPIFVNTA